MRTKRFEIIKDEVIEFGEILPVDKFLWELVGGYLWVVLGGGERKALKCFNHFVINIAKEYNFGTLIFC